MVKLIKVLDVRVADSGCQPSVRNSYRQPLVSRFPPQELRLFHGSSSLALCLPGITTLGKAYVAKRTYCAVALLFLLSCSRQRHREPAKVDRPEQPFAASSERAKVIPASTALEEGAVARTETSAPEPARPSPFAEPRDSRRQESRQEAPRVAAKPAGTPSSASSLGSKPKPFLPSVSKPADRKSVAELPPPPVLTPSVASATPHMPVGQKLCCVATATYEPVKPGRLQRTLQKVPGLRRIQQPTESGDGFSPARPVHEIRFVLPPGTSPVAVEKGAMDLKASVDESGGVTRVQLLFPKDEELVTVAAYAANQWRFEPARLNDKPIASQVILHFQFDRK